MIKEIFSDTNWFIAITIISSLYALYLAFISNKTLLRGSKINLYGFILTICAWIYIGFRPTWAYADTGLYTAMYRLVQSGMWEAPKVVASEWFWSVVQTTCMTFTDDSGWLAVVAGFYIGGFALAGWLLLKRHYTAYIISIFCSYSFFGYATNGLRQGMGAAMVLAGMAILMESRKIKLSNTLKYSIAIAIIYLGCSTHRSLLFTALAFAIAYLFPTQKKGFYIWLICLALSPLSQNLMEIPSMFVEDSRLTYYGTIDDAEMFSRTGWRWDFILYSCVPIVLGWYVTVRKKLGDRTYQTLLNTYLYTNAAWLLINSIAYSNRFAYLSWFFYPVVVVYPLLKFKVFKNQGIWLAAFLVGSCAFLWIF